MVVSDFRIRIGLCFEHTFRIRMGFGYYWNFSDRIGSSNFNIRTTLVQNRDVNRAARTRCGFGIFCRVWTAPRGLLIFAPASAPRTAWKYNILNEFLQCQKIFWKNSWCSQFLFLRFSAAGGRRYANRICWYGKECFHVLVEFLKKYVQGSVQNLLMLQCFCTASTDLSNYFLFFQC